ncbi:MAG: ferrous iron transport protein B [Myxococcales bacterium]|nr:ferrous iron transport protein B [Myxococcales bacterium]
MKQIALTGNPNTGKTTLFNRLTGLNQKVANYPGVTVELRKGTTLFLDTETQIVDLPGTYSLVARSRDEAVTTEFLAGLNPGQQSPDVVVVVIDATNLLRNLYFSLSVLELKLPSVVVLNMMDEAEASGLKIDIAGLERHLQVPVVGISARNGTGIDKLRQTIEKTLASAEPQVFSRSWSYSQPVEKLTQQIRDQLPYPLGSDGVALWVLGSTAASLANQEAPEIVVHPQLAHAATIAKSGILDGATGVGEQLIEDRYQEARHIVDRVLDSSATDETHISDRIDAILLHPVGGLLIFVLTMGALFQGVFAWAEPFMTFIEETITVLQTVVHSIIPPGALADLLADGIVAGVGNVLVFLPQIAFLFAFISVLEDTGYLARAAFISDQIMARIGLHGRAFVPLLSGFACAVPAIMSARAIESPRDRLVTILVTPLISCSARLPIYTLIISSLFASEENVLGLFSVAGLMMLGLYLSSIAVTILAAWILKRTILRGPTPPLVIELPPYRMPSLVNLVQQVIERCKIFVSEAGTVILACSVMLWALLYFPSEIPQEFQLEEKQAVVLSNTLEGPEREDALISLQAEAKATQLRNSYAGRLGQAIEPIFVPLGYDWKIVVGIIGSFAAREVFVSTLSLVYGVQDGGDDPSPLRKRLRQQVHPKTGQPVFTPLVGLSLLAFFLLALQCMSTVAAIRRETQSWNWPLFALVYSGVLAWGTALLIYQGGQWLGFT